MAKPSSSAGQRRGGNPALRMAAIRQWHTMIGVFIAPSIMFFALTGIVQLFSLHEARAGYQPPALIEGLGSVHKDQIFKVKPAHSASAAGTAAAPADPGAAKPKGQPIKVYALKWLFTFVAIGLLTSTSLGLWMALSYGRNKRLLWALLAAGVVLPVLLVAI